MWRNTTFYAGVTATAIVVVAVIAWLLCETDSASGTPHPAIATYSNLHTAAKSDAAEQDDGGAFHVSLKVPTIIPDATTTQPSAQAAVAITQPQSAPAASPTTQPFISALTASAPAPLPTAAPTTLPTTNPVARAGDAPLEGMELSDIDDEDLRFSPTTRPFQPAPQHPPVATTQNTDTGKPVHEWQRFTDDWDGIRPKLDDRGISFQGSLAIYLGDNFSGGAQPDSGGFSYLLNINATLDSKKLFNYDGGTFFINFRQQDGLHTSRDGSFENTSHLYVPRRTQVSEAYYQQQAWDGKISLKVGKIDANDDFDNVANGGEFLNDFASSSPTVLFFPTDPDPAFGADLTVTPTDHFYAAVGVFDGSLQQGRSTGDLGPATIFHGPPLFLIAEAGVKWTLAAGRDGRVGLGIWHHSGDFVRFAGGTVSGATGPYLSLDQFLWRKNPDQDGDTQGIAMFLLSGYADPNIATVNAQVGGGVKWTGMLSGRADDVLGLGANYAHFNQVPGAGFTTNSEVTVETFYKIRFNAWLSAQPDLQYVHSPGGVQTRNDALVGTIQILADL